MSARPVILASLALTVLTLALLTWLSGADGNPALRPLPLEEEPEMLAPVPPVRTAPEPPAEPATPSWNDVNERGIAALDVGDLQAAILAFEACHAADPDEEVFSRNLAEALTRAAVEQHDEADSEEGRLAGIQLLERAVALDPSRSKLPLLLGRWKRSAAAEEGFYVEFTQHFRLSYDLDRGEVRGEIQQVSQLLEEAYQSFSEAFVIRPADNGGPLIRVVLYTREGFDRVTGIGPWAGGVYDGTIRVPVGDLSRELVRVRGVLRHELLHAFVQEKGGMQVPAWLNEGLAQWLEHDRPSGRLIEVDRARRALVGRELYALESLSGSLSSWEDPAEIELAYAQSLALVGWIADRYQNNGVQSVGVLFEMVEGCARGVSAGVTFQQRIGLTLEAVQQDMVREL